MKMNQIATQKAQSREELLTKTQQERQREIQAEEKATMVNAIIP